MSRHEINDPGKSPEQKAREVLSAFEERVNTLEKTMNALIDFAQQRNKGSISNAANEIVMRLVRAVRGKINEIKFDAVEYGKPIALSQINYLQGPKNLHEFFQLSDPATFSRSGRNLAAKLDEIFSQLNSFISRQEISKLSEELLGTLNAMEKVEKMIEAIARRIDKDGWELLKAQRQLY